MNKILLSSVAFIGLATSAMAADLPARRAPIAPAPVFSAIPVFTWTGFYVGVNAGYGFHNNSNNNSVFVPAGTFATAPAAAGTLTFGDSGQDGFVGGGQVGYNYQFGSFVVGAEADIQWADLGGNNRTVGVPAGFPGTFIPAGTPGGVDWFGTVRGRAGFAFDRALIYATGGFAYGGGGTNNNNNFNGVFSSKNNSSRSGYAVGAGVEYAFTNNLTLGVEGLYVNLGSRRQGEFIGTENVGGVTTAVFVPGSGSSRDDAFTVARVKLNYKF